MYLKTYLKSALMEHQLANAKVGEVYVFKPDFYSWVSRFAEQKYF